MSLGETQLRPTAMLFRNLVSMDVEESIRGNPIDGVVLLMGCDKTTPSLLMGAASCDLPTIGLSGGPLLSGKFRGHDLRSGTGLWRMSDQVRSGEMKVEEFFEAESCMHRFAHRAEKLNSTQLGSIFFVYLLGVVITPQFGRFLDRFGFGHTTRGC